MNSLQIHYFLHLCRTGSISETARQLFVAQPAVSKQIAALERELGFALFHRTNRGVSLTPGGELLWNFFSEAEPAFQRVRAEAERRMQGQRERLAVGLLESLGLDELQSVLAGLRSQFPELEITLARLDNPTLLEQLSDGRLDAAVTFDHAMEGRAGVRYEELLLEQSLFVISRDHPLARLDNIVPQALSGQMICETRAREGGRFGQLPAASGGPAGHPAHRVPQRGQPGQRPGRGGDQPGGGAHRRAGSAGAPGALPADPQRHLSERGVRLAGGKPEPPPPPADPAAERGVYRSGLRRRPGRIDGQGPQARQILPFQSRPGPLKSESDVLLTRSAVNDSALGHSAAGR